MLRHNSETSVVSMPLSDLWKREDCTDGCRGKSSLHTQASQIVYLDPDKAETPAAIFRLSNMTSNE